MTTAELTREIDHHVRQYADCAAAGAWCSAERHAQRAHALAVELAHQTS
jgi:hypothetical protein